MTANIIDQIEHLFEHQGQQAYLSEDISITNHMLQCAQLADQAGKSDTVIVAALLHDIGHLLVDHSQFASLAEEDLYHQNSGALFLQPHFQEEVTNAVRQHVSAKRYLCTMDANYIRQLSEASVHTLKLQGGVMSSDEIQKFENTRGFRTAIQVRLLDDQGKQKATTPPDYHYYRSALKSQLL